MPRGGHQPVIVGCELETRVELGAPREGLGVELAVHGHDILDRVPWVLHGRGRVGRAGDAEKEERHFGAA